MVGEIDIKNHTYYFSMTKTISKNLIQITLIWTKNDAKTFLFTTLVT